MTFPALSALSALPSRVDDCAAGFLLGFPKDDVRKGDLRMRRQCRGGTAQVSERGLHRQVRYPPLSPLLALPRFPLSTSLRFFAITLRNVPDSGAKISATLLLLVLQRSKDARKAESSLTRVFQAHWW